MSRWKLMIALWAVAILAAILCDWGVRLEPRTTYDIGPESARAAD